MSAPFWNHVLTSLLSSSRIRFFAWGTATWCLTGLLVLFCRWTGSFAPSTDAWLMLGVILTLQGVVMTLLHQLMQQQVLRQHPVPSGLSIFCLLCGISAWTIGLLTAESSMCVLLATGGMAICLVISMERLIELQMPSVTLEKESPSNSDTPPIDSDSPSDDVQRFRRYMQDTGGETIEGMIKVHIPAGQKQAVAHITFQPALSSIPEIHCEPLGVEAVDVAIESVFTHGCRLEVRRASQNELDSDWHVEIGYEVIAHSDSLAA